MSWPPAGEATAVAANAFRNSIKTNNAKLGRVIHSFLIKTALILDRFLANRLMEMYSKCDSISCAEKVFDVIKWRNAYSWNTMINGYCEAGRLGSARRLFDEMPEPNFVSYNTIISALCRNGLYREAFNEFRKMNEGGGDSVLMDEYTVVGLANACANMGFLEIMRQVHGVAIVLGLDFNVVVCNSFVDAYGKCGYHDIASRIFSHIGDKDVVSWNSMLVAYVNASKLEDACRVFEQIPFKNVVSWTTLIAGFVQNNAGERALPAFAKMQEQGVAANEVTYVSVLSACADLAYIAMGKQIHCHIIRISDSSLFDNASVVNALVDMYSKCGDMVSSVKLFEKLKRKDIISWNSIIVGFAQNGYGEQSLAVFEKMLQANIRPDDVTFIGVLSACSHSGLDSEGLKYLDMMKNEFSLTPRPDHYSIVVDLLGRKNRLEEALEVIERADCGSNHKGMWGALFGSCCVHGNLETAEKAAEVLFELDPENPGRYVTLSNMYKSMGKWDEANQIRKRIVEMNMEKEAGYSQIELKNARNMFIADDTFHDLEYIHKLLIDLANQMKEVASIYE